MGTDVAGAARFSLNADLVKRVVSEFRHLDMAEAVAAVAEFFSELPARASANLQVVFDGTTKASFALVNQIITFGQDMAMAVRERTREATAYVQKKYGISIKVKRGAVTVTMPNPTMG